eukprot:3873722-Alexandrium_andersonii.AAC.1
MRATLGRLVAVVRGEAEAEHRRAEGPANAAFGGPGGLELHPGVRRAAADVAGFRMPADPGVGRRGVTDFPEDSGVCSPGGQDR